MSPGNQGSPHPSYQGATNAPCNPTAQRGLRGTHVPLGERMSPLGNACPPWGTHAPLGERMSPSSFCKAGELKYYHPQVSILCLPFNEKEITVGMSDRIGQLEPDEFAARRGSGLLPGGDKHPLQPLLYEEGV